MVEQSVQRKMEAVCVFGMFTTCDFFCHFLMGFSSFLILFCLVYALHRNSNNDNNNWNLYSAFFMPA